MYTSHAPSGVSGTEMVACDHLGTSDPIFYVIQSQVHNLNNDIVPMASAPSAFIRKFMIHLLPTTVGTWG